MSPMPPDDILKMAGLLAPKSKAAAGMAVAPNQVQIPMALPAEKVGPNGYVTGMPPPEIMAMVASGVQVVGGREARMAMFPDEFPESKTDKPNVVMRGIRGIAAGIADMAPSTMALAAGVIDFMGADEAGAKLGQASLDVTSWLNDHLAVENPNLFDHAMRGFGSMATLALPGLGAAFGAGKMALKLGMVARDAAGVAKLTAEGAQILSKTGQAFRALTGGGAMSFLESAVEQSQREMELIGKGMTPEEALKESAPVFWHNMGVLMATNTVAYFLPLPIKTKNEFIRRAAKAVEAAFTEGGQERAQAVIQAVASGEGEWGDFLDPKKNVTDTLVGAIVGGGTAAMLPGEDEADQGAPGAPQTNAKSQPPKRPPSGGTPQQAPAQAAQPAQPSSPTAAPAAPRPPVPAGMPMEPLEGFDVWTGQDEDEPGLSRTPAEMEAEQVAEAGPTQAEIDAEYERIAAEARRTKPKPIRLKNGQVVQGISQDEFDANLAASRQQAPVAEPDISPEAPAPLRKVASDAKRRKAERKAREQAEVAEINAAALRNLKAAKPVAKPRSVRLKTGQVITAVPQDEFDANMAAGRAEARAAKPAAAAERAEWTGAPDQPVYRGSGRPDPRSIYNPAGPAVALLGKGAYYASTRKDAGIYGPEVSETTSGEVVSNPLVITNNKQWVQLQRDAGADFDMIPFMRGERSESEYEADAEKLRRHVIKLGHDGVVVSIPNDADVDASGQSVKRIREYFGHTTVVSYKQKESKPAPSPPQEAPAAAAPARYEVRPIAAVKTDPARFQVRSDGSSVGVDEVFVQDAVDNYDPQSVNPIEIWKDPKDGQEYVIDGHHTREIESRVGKDEVAVKIFTGTEAEAIAASKKRNDQRRGNDIIAQAGVLRDMRAAGTTKKDIAAEAKSRYRKNDKTVIALSHLNPKGGLIDALKSMKGASDVAANDLLKIAKWIGEVRARDPQITDAHEQEMFDYLRKQMGQPSARNEQEFIQYVENRVGGLGMFDYAKSLNLNNAASRTPAQANYDAELATAKSEKKAAEATLKDKNAEFTAAMKRKKEPISEEQKIKLLIPYEEAVAAANRVVMNLEARKNEINKSGGDEPGLFRMSRPSIANLNKSATEYGLSPAVAQSPRDLMDDIVVRVAKMFGFKNVQFVSGLTTKDGRMAHGYYQPESDTVFLNVGSKEPMLTVTGHEVAHRMEIEHPDLYGQLVQILNDPKNVRVGGKEVYAKDAKARGYGEVGIEREWVADGLMEAWSRPEFWNVLQEKNPTLAGKLINMIVDAIKAIRTMFAASGASVDIYYNNFGPLVRQIANVAAQMQAREAAGAPRLAVDPAQIELFRIAPIANPLANEMRDKQVLAMKKNGMHRHQGWKAGWRHVYMTMMDKHTFTYWNEDKIAKSAGKKFSLTKSPYIALRRFQSWMTQVQVNLEHEVRGIDNQTVLSPGVVPIIRDNGIADDIDSREFGLYYTAATLVSRKYSLQRRGKDFFGKDPASDEYQAAEDEFLKWQKIYDDAGGAQSKWAKAADDFTSYIYALNRRALEANVIDQQEFDNLTKTYSVFAPLMPIGSSEYSVDRGDPVGAGVFAHDMTVFDPTAVFMDPVDALIKRTYAVEYMIRKTQAAQSHANFIRAHKDKALKGVIALDGFGMKVRPKEDPVTRRVDELLKAAGLSKEDIAALGDEGRADLEAEARIWVTSQRQPDGVIALLRGSKVEYWQLDPDIYESFMAAVGPKAMHPLMKFFSAQTSLLRAGAVLTPDFMARNQFRDFASAAIISQHLIRNPADPFLLPVRILRGLSAAIGKTEAFKEFMLEVGHAQLHAQDQNGIRKTSKEATRSASGRFNYVLHSNPITILQEFGKLTENSTRYAVYWKTKNDLLKMKWSESEARVKAAMEARESSIDFARSGKYGQVINQIIPFFNAAVQGNDKTFRTFVVDDGGRGAAWLKATMLVTIPSILLWALNHDEEWYKDQPIWLKNNFWLFSIDGGKTIHKAPKPFEIGLMHASLAERFLDWSVDKDPKAMKEWSEAVLKNVVAVNDKNPIASVGGLLGPMAGTMTEIVSNYDSFRGTPIVKGWLEEVAPREQFNANTSEFAKALGGMAPGRGISPMMIDHFIRGTFGGLGAYAAQAASEVIMLARPELKAMKPSPKQIRTLVGFEVPDWIPVIKAFAQANPAGYTRQMNDFFEIYDRGRESSKTLQAFKAAGAPRDKFISLYRRSGPEIATFKASQEVAEKLGEISKRARFIESLPAEQMSREEKRKQVDQLTETRNLMVKKFLDRYYEIDQKELQRQIEASIPQLERAYGR